jgi:hypothetical protein
MRSWRTIFLVAAVAVSLGFAAARWAQPTSRDELRVVKMERDILGKAVAFFAKENA